MRKSLIAILLTGLFITAAHGICFGQNLIKNGGFEDINPDMTPVGWTISTSRNTEIDLSFDAADKISGNRSLKISVLNPAGHATLLPEKTAIGAPVPGKRYELTLWLKAENLKMSRLMVTPAVRLDFRPTRVRPIAIIDLTRDFESDAGWQQLSLEVTAPNDAKEFVFDILITPGTIWIDDISLTRID